MAEVVGKIKFVVICFAFVEWIFADFKAETYGKIVYITFLSVTPAAQKDLWCGYCCLVIVLVANTKQLPTICTF